jgi:hypothetical protein
MTDAQLQGRTRPRAIILITIAMAVTFSRFSVITYFPHLEMYGGVDANAWFGPWLSDTILGLLVPVMLFVLWRKRSRRVWAMLFAYNALGAFDYAHGLMTQWHYPQMTEGQVSSVIYGAISLGLVMNLWAAVLLMKSEVIDHLAGRIPARAEE